MKLNLDYYKEDINYDKLICGELENEIVQNINNFKDKNYEDWLFSEKFITEKLGVFSQLRENIINWYPLKSNSSVLEIGAKWGEITGVLCDKCKKVTSIEFSKIRGEAIAKRYKTKKNLEIIIGKLNDIVLEEKFDYIILMGILDYAPILIESESPYEDFILYCKKKLRKGGQIIVATDNSNGVKYISGGKNEHTDELYDSCIQKFKNSKTFTKTELNKIIKEANFKHNKYYYPLPDYRFPTTIFTDSFSPNERTYKVRYNPIYNFNSLVVQDEINILKYKIQMKKFSDFTNSFLLVVSDSEIKDRIRFVSFNNLRKTKYSLVLKISGYKVEKIPINDEASEHIKNIEQYIDILKELGFDILDTIDKNYIINSEFIKEPTYDEIIIKKIMGSDKQEVIRLIKKWYNHVGERLTKDIKSTLEGIDYSNIVLDFEKKNEFRFIKNGFIDLVFENTFFKHGKYFFFDQEWMVNNIPLEFILYRAINNIYSNNKKLNNYISFDEILDEFQILKYKNLFNKMEEEVQKQVLDQNKIIFYNMQNKKIIKSKQVFEAIQRKDKLEDDNIELLTRNNKLKNDNTVLINRNSELEYLLGQKSKEIDIYNSSKIYNIYKKVNKLFKNGEK